MSLIINRNQKWHLCEFSDNQVSDAETKVLGNSVKCSFKNVRFLIEPLIEEVKTVVLEKIEFEHYDETLKKAFSDTFGRPGI